MALADALAEQYACGTSTVHEFWHEIPSMGGVFFVHNTSPSRLEMRNARLRVMTGLATAALCAFALTSNAQNTNTPTTSDPTAQTQAPTTTAQPATPTGDASVPAPADAGTNSTVTRSTATDVTTTDNTTTTTSFPGGFWGIVAVGVLVLLALFGLFRGRDRTVVRDTYTTNTVNPPVTTRTTGTGTAVGDRTLNTRVASSSGTSSRVDDSNARS